MKSPWPMGLVLASAIAITACGGGGGGGNNSSASNGVAAPPSTNPGNTSLSAPNAVAVSAGASVSSIDITVPSVTPPLNAQVLGVQPIGSSGGSAANTGGVVKRGSQASVLLFGKGLNGNLTVSIFGPPDLTVSNVVAIKSTTGLPGVQFQVDVNADATPGARTVVLQDSSGNVTTFTGGLEIQ